MAMSKCRTIGLPNHRIAEPFKFCFAEENNIPKNTDTDLELNALVLTSNLDIPSQYLIRESSSQKL